MYQTERILRRFGYRRLLGIDFTKEIMEIRLLFFLQAVTLAVFKKLLFALKPYFLGERKRIAILQPFLLIARIKPQIEIETFLLAVMGNLIFRLSSHRPFGVENRIPVLDRKSTRLNSSHWS